MPDNSGNFPFVETIEFQTLPILKGFLSLTTAKIMCNVKDGWMLVENVLKGRETGMVRHY